MILAAGAVGATFVAAGLGAWRVRQAYGRDTTWATLRSRTVWHERPVATGDLETGQPVADRLLRFLIPGPAGLRTVAELGLLAGPEDGPATAEEIMILAAPSGFALRRHGRWGKFSSVSLLDGAAAQSRWAAWLAPMPAAAPSPPALGASMLGSALLWTPAALLPGEWVRWEDRDAETTRVTASWLGLEQAVEVSVDADGRPTRLAAANGGWEARPLGFTEQDGYRLAAAAIETAEGRAWARRLSFLRFAGPWIGSSHA